MSKLLFTQSDIQQFESVLIDYINERFQYRKQDNPVTVICVLKGGFYITASITRRLSCAIDLQMIKLKSGYNSILPDPNSITNKSIVVIDDIYDSGATCQRVLDWLNELDPANISYFHLLHRATTIVQVQSKAPLVMLMGGKVMSDKWLKGWGMDNENGIQRNLEDIYTIN